MSDPYAPRHVPRDLSPPPGPIPFGIGEYDYDHRRFEGHRQPPPPRRKRRRVFLWVFLAIQALFVAWVIAGAFTKTGAPQAQIASGCYHHAWWPLFKSQADCVTHYGGALNTAGEAGKGIGIALIIIFWMVVDVILGVSYGVYRLATRDR